MDLFGEQVRTFTSAVTYSARTTKQLEMELWIRECESRGSKRPTTRISRTNASIEGEIRGLFEGSKEEVFEEGIENDLSRGLASVIARYGKEAIDVLSQIVNSDAVNEEIAAQTLRLIGRLDHRSSQRDRLLLLEQALNNPSVRVRNAASLSLASLDDPHAIPHLQQAIQRERCVELVEDMEQVLKQLENTRQCRTP